MHYKSTENSLPSGYGLHFIDPEYAHLLPVGCVPITDDEAEAIRIANTPQPTIEEIKDLQWQAIKAERDRRSENGGYKVGTKWFHSDQKSRSQQLGLVLLGSNIPSGTMWKTMDGSFIEMTATIAQQILGAAAASDAAIFTAAEAHRAAMLASENPSTYDFSGGWPQTYGDL